MLAGGLKLREGFGRIARNNILVNNTLHPHVWFANSEDVFEHNIVMTGYQPILIDHWGSRSTTTYFRPERPSIVLSAGERMRTLSPAILGSWRRRMETSPWRRIRLPCQSVSRTSQWMILV